MAGRKIVQPHHPLIELQQRLQQIGADEAGDAGDQPDLAGSRVARRNFFVAGHSAASS